jgi:hypothetical protein
LLRFFFVGFKKDSKKKETKFKNTWTRYMAKTLQRVELEKALAMMISEGDAMVWLLNGLHMLCRANRPKSAAHRMHRIALSERMRILSQKAYDELLQERSAHGSLREVEIEALIARLRLKGMLEMLFDPDSKGLSGAAELEDFGHMFVKIVRSCDDQNLGVITSTALENLMQQLTSKVYNGATLPTFDELGIRVPQTVFFKLGSPVLWYYTCDQEKQGKGSTLMRRNAENTNLANILAVFKDEHARDIGKAIQVIQVTHEI